MTDHSQDKVPTRYRKIMCPDPIEGTTFRLSSPTTGEIRECGDLAVLLRFIADDAIFLKTFSATLEVEHKPALEYGPNEFGEEESSRSCSR